METKAIFLDVDGTLVSFDTHRVPQSAIEALQQVHESGIKIIIATGRAFTDLHELEEIPYDAVIALNGSDCVLRDGTPISRKQIPEKDFQRVLVLAQHYGFALAIETNKGIFVNELNPTVIELARLVNHPTPPVADIEKEFMGGECCQLCIYCDEEMEKEVMAQLPGLSVSRWNPFFADVNVAGVNKAMGINEFASYYGFDVSRTIAFGDGGNDTDGNGGDEGAGHVENGQAHTVNAPHGVGRGLGVAQIQQLPHVNFGFQHGHQLQGGGAEGDGNGDGQQPPGGLPVGTRLFLRPGQKGVALPEAAEQIDRRNKAACRDAQNCAACGQRNLVGHFQDRQRRAHTHDQLHHGLQHLRNGGG